MSQIGQPNPTYPSSDASSNHVYTGTVNAFLGSGTFYAEQGLKDISMIYQKKIEEYQVDTALQVTFDVEVFNKLIGLYKDTNHVDIVSTALDCSYLLFPDNSSNLLFFPIDHIDLSASGFAAGVTNPAQVMNVGALSTLYSDFNKFVTDFFTSRYGFETLFDISAVENYNNGTFDKASVINLIHPTAKDVVTNAYISDLSGVITISDINTALRDAVYRNPFGNRSNPTDMSGNYLVDTSKPFYLPELDANGNVVYELMNGHMCPKYTNIPVTDVSGQTLYKNVFSIEDGFLDGDLIFVPEGFQVTLKVDLLNNNIDLNQTGFANVASYIQKQNLLIDQANPYKEINTIADDKHIITTMKVPLLIKLKNTEKILEP